MTRSQRTGLLLALAAAFFMSLRPANADGIKTATYKDAWNAGVLNVAGVPHAVSMQDAHVSFEAPAGTTIARVATKDGAFPPATTAYPGGAVNKLDVDWFNPPGRLAGPQGLGVTFDVSYPKADRSVRVKVTSSKLTNVSIAGPNLNGVFPELDMPGPIGRTLRGRIPQGLDGQPGIGFDLHNDFDLPVDFSGLMIFRLTEEPSLEDLEESRFFSLNPELLEVHPTFNLEPGGARTFDLSPFGVTEEDWVVTWAEEMSWIDPELTALGFGDVVVEISAWGAHRVVPEPATMVFLALGGIGALWRRKSHRFG